MLPIDAGLKAPVVQDSYLDQQGLNSIKAMGRDKDPQALKEIAKKFEAMFVQQMLKTMREANDVFSEDNYLNSNESRFHRDMMDQQLVLNLTSGAGMGLATQFYQQMSQAYGHGGVAKDAPTKADGTSLEVGELASAVKYTTPSSIARPVAASSSMNEWMNAYTGESDENNNDILDLQSLSMSALLLRSKVSMHAKSTSGIKTGIADSPENFVALLKPHAEKAAQELNVNPDVLIAQVALETGWGKHVIHNKGGENSFNLFNIKAGGQWQGDKVNVSTVEYRNGIAAAEKADFRKYADYSESFSDYVRLLKNNPRYQDVLDSGKNSTAYAEALQTAGYATDPEYAQKIKQLLNSDVIRDQRALTQTEKQQNLLSMNTTALSIAENSAQTMTE